MAGGLLLFPPPQRLPGKGAECFCLLSEAEQVAGPDPELAATMGFSGFGKLEENRGGTRRRGVGWDAKLRADLYVNRGSHPGGRGSGKGGILQILGTLAYLADSWRGKIFSFIWPPRFLPPRNSKTW